MVNASVNTRDFPSLAEVNEALSVGRKPYFVAKNIIDEVDIFVAAGTYQNYYALRRGPLEGGKIKFAIDELIATDESGELAPPLPESLKVVLKGMKHAVEDLNVHTHGAFGGPGDTYGEYVFLAYRDHSKQGSATRQAAMLALSAAVDHGMNPQAHR